MSRMKPHWEWQQARSSQGPHGRQIPDPGPYMAVGEPALGIRSILIAVGRAVARLVRTRRAASQPRLVFEGGALQYFDADGRRRELRAHDVRAVTRTVTPAGAVVAILGTDGQRIQAREGEPLEAVLGFVRSLNGVRADRLEATTNGRHVVWSVDHDEVALNRISL